MSVTPTGFLSEPLAGLRNLIAKCPSFQAWVGATGTDEEKLAFAIARIHLLVRPKGATRPNVLLDFGDFSRVRDAITNRRRWTQGQGSNLLAFFRENVAANASEEDAGLSFCNSIGAIWADMEQLAGEYASGTFACTEIELVVAPGRVEVAKRETAGDYFECAISPTFSRQAA